MIKKSSIMRGNILMIVPMHNNGGIASWTKKFLAHFPQDEYKLTPIALDPIRESGNISVLRRISTGLSALKRIMAELRVKTANTKFDIMHKTTSGSFGALSDWVIGRYCRRKGIKTIMHCRYGCIPEVLSGSSFIGWLTKRSMNHFDQIWVLDRRTYEYLRQRKDISAEIILTPNCIDVKSNLEITPKSFTDIAFIGNLYETKGLIELIEAVKKSPDEIKLHIVGDGDPVVKQHIKEHAGDLLGSRIKCYGRLANKDAVEFMKKVDILALPTYYPSEAFPISILEAMSLGKLVISTRRAAIGDMLTSDDGKSCGLFVREKSIEDIVNAINWAYYNKAEADELCRSAYEKVYNSYRTEVVYRLYSDCYNKILHS